MTRLLETIRNEPVRTYLYGVLIAGLAVLVGVGVLNSEHALLWAGLGAAVFAVPAVEAARAKVTPTAKTDPEAPL